MGPMRTLYVGDIHGCATELAALLREAAADRVVLVGDLFTKGPDPLGVWALIRECAAEAVLGNHDDYVLSRWEDPSYATAVLLRERAPELRAWLEDLPLFLEHQGVIVVHAGLHPTGGVPQTTRAMALTMRRWPPDGDSDQPFWYDAGWKGPQTVVFGHDAKRGLVRRERRGRPIAIGLDSGCVYGGRLSGWIREEDRILSVPALRVWREPKGGR